MIKLKKLLKNKTLLAFLSSFLLGTIIILPNIIEGHGVYSLIADFNVQQIPFNKIMNESIKEGSVLWTWYNELGNSFIGSFSFYNLFSPFNIIGFIFPASWFEYLVGPIFILKYAVAGLTSYLFLKRYVKNKNYAILGSILYSFSGFQLTNMMYYHFHDVVALFPLLLYALDKLVYDNKKFIFGLSVTLLAFTNWFFFIGEVVFVVIYYVIKIATKSYKFKLKTFLNIVFESLLGLCIASIAFIPSILSTMSNARINTDWTLITSLRHATNNYLEILRGVLFPPEIMSHRAIVTESNYQSIEMYLPFVGVILSISYFFKKPKNWDSIFMVILVIIMFIPILNSMFFAFTVTYYARWFYMAILIFSLTSIKCLDENISFKKGIIINVILVIAFVLGCFIYTRLFPNGKFIYDKNYLIVMIVSYLISIFALIIIDSIKKQDLKLKMIYIMVIIFICFWGNFVTYKYKLDSGVSDSDYKEYLNVSQEINLGKTARINSSSSCNYNLGLLTKNGDMKSFNSNINGSLFKFYKSIGYERNVSTDLGVENKDLSNFLGAEYIISCGNDDISYLNYNLIKDSGTFKLYYNKNYKKQGFSVDKFISYEDFNKLGYEDRIITLNDTIVLSKKQINEYQNLFNENAIYKKHESKYIKNGIKSNILSNKSTLAIYTVPYDKGWKATVNGKNTKIEEVDNGFMAIKIDKGKNNIEFKYFPVGLKLGIIMSSISLITFIIYVIINKRGIEVKNEK
ncbi:MAG TPA: YfhO family protein [Candidatus Aphodocola excrementigallinarum]|uniref:YfhO family protein n=1 Tax=Candidatus Aphodocola excrementigallinarum TaxID=2840670 RepID=A0A9D1IMI6_9FIRM|nr:YfhO family protein [Candidatus Aphodocola excrementigallinarum]